MAYQRRNLVFCLFWALKNVFLGQKGGKNSKFEKFLKVTLDILEIHGVSKFGPIRMKIVAGSLSEHTLTTTTDFSVPWYTIIPTVFYNYTTYLPT